MVTELSMDQKLAISTWLAQLGIEDLSDKVYRLIVNDMTGNEILELLQKFYEAGAVASAEIIKGLLDEKAIKL